MSTAPPVTGIALRGLTKSFRGREDPTHPVHAVRGIDLDIAPGETVALLGPNGAGKSTTIEMLLALAAPDGGSASLFGLDPAQAVAEGRVSAMLQTGALIQDLTVRELVLMAASLYPRAMDVDEALGAAGIAELARRRTQTLSGGQAQRVRFAVALVGNADLLVLDEPTVAMDVDARRAFWATMRGVAEGGTTVLFATHHLEEAEDVADRVVLMAHGRVVADGSPAEVKAKVGQRTIRARVPGADEARLRALPGVRAVDRRGPDVVLRCDDADRALRALLASEPAAHDLEVRGAGLEEAFLQLTADHPEESWT
jgi:ABC-2 type transport system ATP-binding protein